MTGLLRRLGAIALTTFVAFVVTDAMKLNSGNAAGLVMFGGVFFFLLSEYFTECGFFVKGQHINKPTPGCVWKLVGVLLWIAAAVAAVWEA